ncbi:MAG: murein DD-endopeptidase MepM/ murein hydrolase activator NlpD [Ilumatobacter sp.]|jgi:murein DD-endopeptidase MepM/ murein hydrolase activator NlpD
MLGASVLGLGAARVLADPMSFTGPATALEPAQRLGIDGELTFPVDPTGGDLVMPNGYREGVHKGLDIGNGCSDGRGRLLIACADAVVNSMDQSSRPGKYITLRDGSDTYYRYHHLDEFIGGMQVGDAVSAGQVVGLMGTTGNTIWPHVHFEVWRQSLNPSIGLPVDPLPLLQRPPGLTIGPPQCSD